MQINLKNREITEFTDNIVLKAGNYFMRDNETLTNFSAPKLEYVGDCFLENHPRSKEFNPNKTLC
jgi:hypothetical protein